MNMGMVSLFALAVAIILGFIRKSNVGIISIGMALIIAVVYHIKTGDIMKGFSTSLFLTMTGVSYLFSIVTENRTLAVVAAKLIQLAGKHRMLIYLVMFACGFIICAVGPGAIPSLAIIPVLAIPVAVEAGINPVLLCLAGQMGVQGGRMSPITPESAVVLKLMQDQSLSTSAGTVPILYCLLLTEVFLFLSTFVYFKGWKFTEVEAREDVDASLQLNKEQIISLIALVVMILCVLVLKMNVGLTSFLIGSVLILLGIGKEGKTIKSIPWNVIFMVLGVGVLMNIVVLSGGIKLLANSISYLMSTSTASAVMVCISGFMSFFSSGLGVVFPTLIPTCSKIVENLPGVNPVELVSMVVIGGTITGFSPISTAGALIMASISSDEEQAEKYPQNKLFVDLFVVAFLALIVSSVLGFLGIYTMILK